MNKIFYTAKLTIDGKKTLLRVQKILSFDRFSLSFDLLEYNLILYYFWRECRPGMAWKSQQ